MLNVPGTVKALFKKGGVRKNFRVQFPNGEHADLTNADIVAESVSFTESLCSGSRFQFGLSERSELEFECVNVPNIYGCVIEAGIEIDISSLSAAQITAIASDPGDGALVYDLGPVYYRVPYGTFTVESCPRQHGNMKHRKVTAYGRKPASVVQSDFLQQKYSGAYLVPEEIPQNPLMMIADASNDISFVSTTEGTLQMRSSGYGGATAVGNHYLVISVTDSRTKTAISGLVGNNPVEFATDAVYRLTSTFSTAFYEALIEDLEDRYGELSPKQITAIRRCFFPHVTYDYTSNGWNVTNEAFIDGTDSGYFYGYMPLRKSKSFIEIRCPVDITRCKIMSDSTESATLIHDYGTTSNIMTNIAVKYYQLTDSREKLLKVMLKSTGSKTVSGKMLYSFTDAADISKLCNGVYEVEGSFRTVGRNDQLKTVTLDSSSPESIIPGQYSDLWWDDYDIDSIGTVIAKYNNGDAQQETTMLFAFGNGASIYDMKDNLFLKSLLLKESDLGETCEEFVGNLLNPTFITNAQEVNFTPAELTMQGLPYLEAGDYLAIDDADSGTVNTYILRRTLRGIQTLYDDIESTGGEIIQGD